MQYRATDLPRSAIGECSYASTPKSLGKLPDIRIRAGAELTNKTPGFDSSTVELRAHWDEWTRKLTQLGVRLFGEDKTGVCEQSKIAAFATKVHHLAVKTRFNLELSLLKSTGDDALRPHNPRNLEAPIQLRLRGLSMRHRWK